MLVSTKVTLLILFSSAISLRSENSSTTTFSTSGRSLTEYSATFSSSSQSSPNQPTSTTSQDEFIDRADDKAESTALATNDIRDSDPPAGSEHANSVTIDLYKRMLQKTRHIRIENRRLRRRSPQNNNNNNKKKPSLCLREKLLQRGAFTDGKPTGGQAASLTSNNNFINFCDSRFARVAGEINIMDGKQQTDKPACNGVVMGMVPDKKHMPSCKFISPRNLDKVKVNESLTIKLKVRNIVLGVFTNPKNTYLAGPVQLDPDTLSVLGHTHIVVQPIDALNSVEVIDPTKFFFFKGIDNAAVDDVVSVTVDCGLPAGVYKISTVTTAANHQPISSAVAQRGSFDDIIYITAEGKSDKPQDPKCKDSKDGNKVENKDDKKGGEKNKGGQKNKR
ncbi:hypothetical protein PSHT_02574 [Puccinia striiformis]|uniref:Uncharacterized protein n=1 Tax=Puccinia striiformis TaxID=27350 RepID=A0A2S4WHR7_9BASI|nr:hypothetical protein PSHT_02574 [Puccinia striiformis]